MTQTRQGGAGRRSGYGFVIAVCLILLQLLGPGAERCLADMNPPKPITAKPYVPKTPKIIRSSRVPAGRIIPSRKGALRMPGGAGKRTALSARDAWQKRLTGQYTQASQAGTVSTLLAHN